MTRKQIRGLRPKEICPVCGHAGWCGVAADSSFAICMRSESPRKTKNGGWYHVLNGNTAKPVPSFAPDPEQAKFIDCRAILQRYMLDTTTARIAEFADDLGVSRESLKRLGTCWSANHKAWAFPMSDGQKIVGIRLRGNDGSKFSVRGSKAGIFLPTGFHHTGPLLVCEGPTDCAALLDLNYDAIGRPSCAGTVEPIIDLMRLEKRDAVIFADRDGPGLRGAEDLAERLPRRVRIVTPPRHKDARAWKNAGATRCAVELVISAAKYVRR